MERFGHHPNTESALAFHFGTVAGLRFYFAYRFFSSQLEGLRFRKCVEIGPYHEIAQEHPDREAKLAVQSEASEHRDRPVARKGYIELSSSGARRLRRQTLQLSKAGSEVLGRNSPRDGRKMRALGALPHNAII